MDYETFVSLSPLKKPRAFHEMTAENKCEIVSTQYRRFLDMNRERMSPDQVQFLEETLRRLKPEDYVLPRSAEREEQVRRNETRFEELFPVGELRRLHFEVLMHSGEIANAIARAIAFARPSFDDNSADALQAALYDLATRPASELRGEIAEILTRAFDGIPASEEFWKIVDDEEVRLAAQRAHNRLKAARVRNPILLSMRKQKPLTAHMEEPLLALQDLGTLSPQQLREKHPELPEILSRAFEDMPSGDDFWSAVDDEDVRFLANKMRTIIELQQNGELPPPRSRR